MNARFLATGAAALIIGAGTADAQYYQYELASVDDEGSLSIDQTTDGGFVTAGWRKVVDDTGIFNKDFYIVKHNKDGQFQWLKVWGGPEDDVAYSIRQTMDGGYIIAGETESFEQNFELVLLRLDANGRQLWANSYLHQVAGDTIHHPHPGVALDLLMPEEEILVTGYFNGHPLLMRTDPFGTPLWQMQYFVPPMPPMIVGAQHAFTDVDIDQQEMTAVVSGSIEYQADDPGVSVTRDDAILMKVDLHGFPLWYFKYDWPFDRDNPDDPNVAEFNHGVDIGPDGFIYSAGKTDFGRPFIDEGPITIVTDPGGVPFSMMRYQPTEVDGRILFGSPAYAAVEFDRRFFTVAIAGNVMDVGTFINNAFLMMTDPMMMPFWVNAYGSPAAVDPIWITWGESVVPADITCGWGVAGRAEREGGAPGFLGAGDNYLVKTEDNGVSGCFERPIMMNPEMPGVEMPLQVEPFQNFGFFPLPDLLRSVPGQELQLCFYPTCYTGPCNAADLAQYWGILDLADVNAFINAFVNHLPAADINNDGVWDLSDINLFVAAFLAGCP
jgi:hypothetical protein